MQTYFTPAIALIPDEVNLEPLTGEVMVLVLTELK